jgi:molecular chaperone HscB
MRPTLEVDQTQLAAKYIELSRQHHPDYHSTAGTAQQLESTRMSALINNAYKTFRSKDETIRYVLQQKGLLEDEEKYVMPPDFLMEVLEINEQLMDASDDPDLKIKLLEKVSDLNEEIYADVASIIKNYRDGETSIEHLLKVKEYYYKKKYLERIRRELKN